MKTVKNASDLREATRVAFTEQDVDLVGESFQTRDGKAIGQIAMRVTRTERMPLTLGQSGQTVGDIIDNMMTDAARHGDDVESLHVELTETEWRAFRDAMRSRDQEWSKTAI